MPSSASTSPSVALDLARRRFTRTHLARRSCRRSMVRLIASAMAL
jgi:hypothetical protein